MTITVCGAITGCASTPAASPAITVVVDQPPVDPLTPAERLLALITADNPRLEKVAMSLASVGDRPVLWTAGQRLVAIARAIGTPAWRETERARIASEAEEDPRSLVTAQVQIEERETRALASVLAAMFHVGGPAVVSYCFALAEDEAAPLDRRRLALRVLDRVVDPGDMARVARRAQLLERVRAPIGSFDARRASEAVRQMRGAFARCYRRALQEDPALQARVELKLHVGANGKVTSTVQGDRLPPELARCLTDVAKRFTTLDLEEPGTVIAVPFTFSAQ